METIRQVEAWWAYGSRCAQLPANAPSCDLFWNAVAILVVIVFTLVALYIIRRMVRNFLAVRAENARVAERARVADEATMAQYKAGTDKVFEVSTDENVEQRIKQALDERKLGASWTKKGPA
jgi:flagellar biosynthesis/type III secretory pathway M-ring protein FliF/YscJ